jgi:hypothetical protein
MFNKKNKEIEKKMLIKKTINTMNKQIDTLEAQKKVFIEKAKYAKKNGLESQYNLALTGYKMTLAQQKRAQEMLLNFEITAQMKDMTMMTSEFLGGMGVLSKQMAKLANNKDFVKVQKQFEVAMANVETQTQQIEVFMETSKDSFANASGVKATTDDTSVEDFIEEGTVQDEFSDDAIDAEMEKIRKEIEGQNS